MMPLRPVDGKIAIRILIDRPMMEIFANHGEQVATLPYENDLNIESVRAFCGDGDARLVSLEVYQLNARWATPQAELAISKLTCEYATNPLGVDTPRPRFGWLLTSDKRSQMQSAYRVLVATSEKQLQANIGDKWDSGRINSDRSVNVEYRGKPLASRETCTWKVRVWDQQGRPSAWSQPGRFEMGLMKQSDWKGRWIGVAPPSPPAEHLDATKPGRVNLALVARPSTSYVSGHETLDAINDGFKLASSNDKRYGAYGNWPRKGTQWVQYEWPKPVHVDAIDVYWFDDRAGVRLPKAARLLYWDGTAFVSVKNPVGLGVEGNKYNTTVFDEITTSRLKLEFDSNGTASTGILEFRVYDAGRSPKFPPAVKVNRFFAMAAAAIAPSPLLRKEFAVTKAVRRARVHFSGLGWSELTINGKKVSDDVLSPGLTDYSQEVLYRTYDVTRFLKPGKNAIGIMLGNGWYSASRILPWERGGPWGYQPRALLQMTVTHDDGTEVQLLTDRTWKTSRGPIGANQLVAGEAYDARLEKPDWNKVGYDDSQWSDVAVLPAPEGRLKSQTVPAMKVQETFRPIRITEHESGGWLFEFDRYFSGWVLLKTKGKAGNQITIHYELGEKDTYILKGDPDGETYEPRFTIHPVRYVRVEGLKGKPTLDSLLGREVYSDVDMHGRFTCSNDLLNQIHGNIQRSLKVAYKGFVLDCLHREPIFYNEPASYFGTLSARKYTPRLWTEVAWSIPLAGSENGDLSDIVPRLPGMNRASDVSQNAAYPMLVWYLYQCHGDKRLIEQHFHSVKAWVDFIGRDLAGENHIVTKGWLGEHMLPGRETGHWEFISAETPKDFIWTCYYYHNTRTLANMCRVLGKKEEEERYVKLAQEIRTVINKTWLDSKTGHYATKSQTSEILPLALDIVPQENKQQLIENIAKTITEADGGKLRVGHVGLPGFMESLVESGLGEIVYDAVNHTEFPGWGYMVDQGATTVWESWGMLKGGYHAEESMTMLAGVGRLFYESIAGIQEPPFYGTREFRPGYRHFHIKPHLLGDLKHAEASIKTVRGNISSSWKRTKDSFVLEIEVPFNSTAKVSVPAIGLKNPTITEGGAVVWKDGAYVKGIAGVTAAKQEVDCYTFDVGSGQYQFFVGSSNKP
jgi:alpha-L-rhamnosidase